MSCQHFVTNLKVLETMDDMVSAQTDEEWRQLCRTQSTRPKHMSRQETLQEKCQPIFLKRIAHEATLLLAVPRVVRDCPNRDLTKANWKAVARSRDVLRDVAHRMAGIKS